jgi:hypothetical protein
MSPRKMMERVRELVDGMLDSMQTSRVPLEEQREIVTDVIENLHADGLISEREKIQLLDEAARKTGQTWNPDPAKNPPPGLTDKGDRMYRYVRDAYVRAGRSFHPARRMAAQTVIARATEHPEWGLARSGYYGNPVAHNPHIQDGSLVYRVAWEGRSLYVKDFPEQGRDTPILTGGKTQQGAFRGRIWDAAKEFVSVHGRALSTRAERAGAYRIVLITPEGLLVVTPQRSGQWEVHAEWMTPRLPTQQTEMVAARGNPNVVGDAHVYRVVKRVVGGETVYYLQDFPTRGDMTYVPSHNGLFYGVQETVRVQRDEFEQAMAAAGAKRIVFITPDGRLEWAPGNYPVMLTSTVEEMDAELKAAGLTNPGRRRSPRAATPPDFERAAAVVEDFNDRDLRGRGRFTRTIAIPAELPLGGPVTWLTYRSDKWNDGTHEYIHKITSQPHVRVAIPGHPGTPVRIPQKIRDAVTLSQIGMRALGFAYKDPSQGDEEVEAKIRGGKAAWYWSPTAKALYLIENRSKLLAVIWGGKLDVEPRGIVG